MLFSFKEFSVLLSRVISWKEYFGVGYWYWLDRVFEKKRNFWYSDYTIHETLCKYFLNCSAIIKPQKKIHLSHVHITAMSFVVVCVFVYLFAYNYVCLYVCLCVFNT